MTWDLDIVCLGTINGARTYDDLVDASLSMEFDGRQSRVLKLEELLAIKIRAGRPKALAAIPYIESTIAETRRVNG